MNKEEAVKKQELSRTIFSRVPSIVKAAKVNRPISSYQQYQKIRKVTFEGLIGPSEDICIRHLDDLRGLYSQDKVLRPREQI